MVVGTGEGECKSCGYVYVPSKGDPTYPVAPGIQFKDLPADWQCPTCGAEKDLFVSRQREVAGFAANQGYGLGTNSMTGDQKSLVIYGSLAVFFLLFLLGYTIN
jgi:rubredoxin